MGMSDVQVVCLNGTLYVGGGYTSGTIDNDAKLYSIELRVANTATWTAASVPAYGYALTVYNSQLQLVGGCLHLSEEITNKIFTLRGTGEIVEALPPMIES